MKPLDKIKLLRFCVYGVVIVLLFIIGSIPGIIPEVLGAKPSFMIAAAICIALTGENELAAMGFGIACGLLCDYSHGGVYGFNAIMLAVICYFTALLIKGLFHRGMVSALFITVISLIIVFIMRWLFYYVVWGGGSVLYALVNYYLPPALYTFIACIPIYFIFRGLSKALRSKRITQV